MREIKADRVRDAAADLAQRANFILRKDVKDALKMALAKETDQRARKILKAIINNAEIAKKKSWLSARIRDCRLFLGRLARMRV